MDHQWRSYAHSADHEWENIARGIDGEVREILSGGTYSRNHGTRMWGGTHSDLAKMYNRNADWIDSAFSLGGLVFFLMGVYVPTSIAVLTSIGATLDLALGLNTFFLSGVGVLEVALPVIGAIGIALLSVLEICKSTGWAGWSSGGMFGGTTGGGMGPSSGG